MFSKFATKTVTMFLLSKISLKITSEISRILLKLMGVGRIPSINEEVQAILELSKDFGQFDILDIGANVGNYSLEIKSVNPIPEVYAFEPSKMTFSTLVHNTENTGIHCVNVGFGERIQVTKLYFDAPKSGLASLSKRNLDHFKINFGMSEDVQILTLDYWLATNKIKENLVVKMDIEGHELFALKGAQAALKSRIKVLQFEFGGANVSSTTFFIDIWSILKETHSIYRLTAKGLHPITTYSEDLENFVNTTYYAKAKF